MLVAYDQDRWAETLDYSRETESSLQLFTLLRKASCELLAMRSIEAFEGVSAIHPEDGSVSIEDWIVTYAQSAEIHAQQISRARQGRR